MTSSKNTKKNKPLITYKFVGIKSENDERLNRAFDILFEETLKENNNLTTIDN